MANLHETQYFGRLEKEPENEAKRILMAVSNALREKGYNPVNQIVGYILSGDPTYITSYQNARVLIRKLERDELLEELRGQGYTDLAGVKYGILETNGRLSVLPYAEQRPATARQLGLESRETGLPVVIISDGRILQDNLKRRGLDLSWLDKQLAEHGYPDFRDVFLLTVDEAGGVYFVPREGK